MARRWRSPWLRRWPPSPTTVAYPSGNPQTKSWQLPTVEHISWKAPDGETVGGVLELPADYKKVASPVEKMMGQ